MIRVTGATKVFALLGRPVHHSRSPALHNAWFEAYGVDAVYVALPVEVGAEDRVVDSVRALGLAGANLTTPLKQRALAGLDSLDAAAEEAGAVNVIVRDGGALRGANTDVEGFCRSVEERGVALRGRDAAILGAGGAARAVAAGLAGRGAARIRIAGRTADRVESLCAEIGRRHPGTAVRPGPLASASVAGADLVVVATSGRPEAVAALDLAALAPGAVWVDLNYWDPDPVGFRAAAAAGCTTIDGGGMLLWQAALAFELWTGILPARDPRSAAPK